jgi:mono/diheme cytochrome c family protein
MLNRLTLSHLRNLLYIVVAIAACGATSALAQGNAANGATLYVQRAAGVPIVGQPGISCQDCHGFAGTFRDLRFPGASEATILAAINSAINGNAGAVMGGFSVWTQQQRSDVAAHLVVAITPPPPPPFAPLPTPSAAPSPVMFSSTAVGTASATIAILLTNSAGTAVTLGNPHVVPATGQIGDFRSAVVPTGQTACANGFILQPGTSCSIGAQFVPTATGARTATWNVTFVGNVPSREVTLQGTATGVGTSPTTSANAPLNAGAGALGWINLLGLLVLLGVSRTRRK